MQCLEHINLYAQQALSDAGLPSFTPPSHPAAAAAAAVSAQPSHSHSHSQPQPQPQQQPASAAAAAAPSPSTAPGVGTLHPTPHQAEPSHSYARAARCSSIPLPAAAAANAAAADSTGRNHARSMAHSGDTPTPKAPMTRLRAFQQKEHQPSYGHHEPYDEAYCGDVGSEHEEEEWGNLEEQKWGLIKFIGIGRRGWRGRRGRTRGRKVAGLSMGTSLSSLFGMCMALERALLMLMQS